MADVKRERTPITPTVLLVFGIEEGLKEVVTGDVAP